MNIFVTWINVMYVMWSELPWLPWWSSRDLIRYHSPSDFYSAKFPKTRVIVDGTECPIAKPSTYRENHWSWKDLQNIT